MRCNTLTVPRSNPAGRKPFRPFFCDCCCNSAAWYPFRYETDAMNAHDNVSRCVAGRVVPPSLLAVHCATPAPAVTCVGTRTHQVLGYYMAGKILPGTAMHPTCNACCCMLSSRCCSCAAATCSCCSWCCDASSSLRAFVTAACRQKTSSEGGCALYMHFWQLLLERLRTHMPLAGRPNKATYKLHTGLAVSNPDRIVWHPQMPANIETHLMHPPPWGPPHQDQAMYQNHAGEHTCINSSCCSSSATSLRAAGGHNARL